MSQTKEEIEKRIEELEREAETLNIVQFALKTLLNSYYGALANQYCSYFDLRLATSITKGGQVSVRGTAAYVESRTNGKIPNNYTDTDSVSGDSKVTIDGKKLSIEDAFESIEGELIKVGEKEYKIPFEETLSPVYTDGKVEDKKINSIYRHLVKNKKRIRITTKSGKIVDITEDHSIMIFDGKQLISKKPLDCAVGDCLIIQ